MGKTGQTGQPDHDSSLDDEIQRDDNIDEYGRDVNDPSRRPGDKPAPDRLEEKPLPGG